MKRGRRTLPLKGCMKLEEYLKDLESQHQAAIVQTYRIEGAIQVVKFLIEEEKKQNEELPKSD